MLSWKNLLRRKVRTGLTVLGVAVGVAVVVALIAASKGLRGQLDQIFAAGNSHLVLTRKGAADPFISYLPDTMLSALQGVEGVAAADPVLFGAIQIPRHPFFFAFGVSPGSPFLSNVRISEGRGLFDPGKPERSGSRAASGGRASAGGGAAGPVRRIVLGRDAAEHLECHVGSVLQLAHGEYEVVGIFESATPFVTSGSLMAFEDAQRETGLEGKMSSAMIRFERFDPTRVDEYEARMEAAFPMIEATAPSEFTRAFDEFALMDEAVTVFSILAVFIGGIGVANTMLMSVFERTREFGVLMAIGWSRGMVLRQVLAEASIVCVLGGLAGIALGMLGVEGLGTMGQFAWLSGEYDLALFVRAMIVALAMGLVGALYPAWRAVRIAPMEALRYV